MFFFSSFFLVPGFKLRTSHMQDKCPIMELCTWPCISFHSFLPPPSIHLHNPSSNSIAYTQVWHFKAEFPKSIWPKTPFVITVLVWFWFIGDSQMYLGIAPGSAIIPGRVQRTLYGAEIKNRLTVCTATPDYLSDAWTISLIHNPIFRKNYSRNFLFLEHEPCNANVTSSKE